jgi:hypothetical protein
MKHMRLSVAFLFPDLPEKNDGCWHEKAIASIIYNLNSLNSQNMEKRVVKKIGNCSAFGLVAIWCDFHKTSIYKKIQHLSRLISVVCVFRGLMISFWLSLSKP